MKRMIMIVLLGLLPVGCSSMNPLGMVTDLINPNKPSLEIGVEAVAGDKKEEVNTQVGDKNNQQAGVINNTSSYDPLMLLLLILGWVLPSPTEMWRGLTNFRLRKNNG